MAICKLENYVFQNPALNIAEPLGFMPEKSYQEIKNTATVVSLDYFLYLCSMNKKRELYFFKDYFEKFYEQQTEKVQKKILWTLRIIEELERIPEVYMKYLKNTSGLYEIRIQVGNNIYRIFCFFDIDNLVIIGHGFQKKSQKTPKQEIERAEQIKREYYESKG